MKRIGILLSSVALTILINSSLFAAGGTGSGGPMYQGEQSVQGMGGSMEQEKVTEQKKDPLREQDQLRDRDQLKDLDKLQEQVKRRTRHNNKRISNMVGRRHRPFCIDISMKVEWVPGNIPAPFEKTKC